MSIVYRQELGRELTWSEADNNFAELKAGVDSKKSNFDVLPVTQGGTGQTTVDAVKVAFDIATKTDLASSAAGKGAEMVGYLPAGTGAVATDVQQQLRNIQEWTVNVKDAPFYAKGDGVTDDTAAIQAAIDTGKSVFVPAGIYKTTSSLNFTTAINSGQKVIGAGSTPLTGWYDSSDLTKTVIRPSSAVTSAFQIDGTSAGIYVQNLCFEDFTVDLVNVTDVSTNNAINQGKAWGIGYKNIRVVNEGSNKRGFKFNTGAFTTTLDNCTSSIIEMVGTSLADAVTTINLIGCDFQQVKASYAVAINVFGGAVQGTIDKFDLSNINGFYISGLDVEGTGTYLVIGSTVNHLVSFGNEFSGFSGTYKTGAPTDSALFDYISNQYELTNTSFVVTEGIFKSTSSAAAVSRNVHENTNGTAQQVDTQYKNSTGSGYVGVDSSGRTFVDGRAGAGTYLQVGGTNVLGSNVNGELYVYNNVAASATAGAATLPANPVGFLIVNIGGTLRKIPYYAT